MNHKIHPKCTKINIFFFQRLFTVAQKILSE